MKIPHLIKSGSDSILLGKMNPEPPKVDCRVWAEDNYQEIVKILVEVREHDVQKYLEGESLMPQSLRKRIHAFLTLNGL